MKKRKIIIPLIILMVAAVSGILVYRFLFSAVKVTDKEILIEKFNGKEDISWYSDLESRSDINAVYGPGAGKELLSEDPLDYVAFDVSCYFRNDSPVSDYWLNGYLDVGGEYSDRFLFSTVLSMGASEPYVFRGDEDVWGQSCLVFCRKGLADEELEKIAKSLELHITGNGEPLGSVDMVVPMADCSNINITVSDDYEEES